MRNLVLVGETVVSLGEEAAGAIVCCDATRVFVVTRALEVVVRFLSSSQEALRLSLVQAGLAALPADTAVAAEYLAESDSLCVCLRNGDIVSVALVTGAAECVGTVDSGALGMTWSPDGELVVFATGNATLFCLSRAWLPVAETPIRGGGGAPLAFALSFEGDGARFATCTRFADGSVHAAIWSRECALLAACELDGAATHGPAVAFRPTGFLVAASHAREDAAHVALYESNGLAHGGFLLRGPAAAPATDLCWSPDGALLALACGGVLQVWRSSNYVWHLAWEDAAAGSRPLGWAPERPGRLLAVGNGALRALDFVRDVSCSALASHGPRDQACVCVADGALLRVAALTRAVVPPPLCEAQLELPFAVTYAAVAGTLLAALSTGGRLALARLDSYTRAQVGSLRLLQLPAGVWMQLAWASETQLVALSSGGLLVAVDFESADVTSELQTATVGPLRLYGNVDQGRLLLAHGTVVSRVTLDAAGRLAGLQRVATLPEVCPFLATAGAWLLAQSTRFKLYAHSLEDAATAATAAVPVVVESECTSFATHAHFLVWTTLKSQLRFATLGEAAPVAEAQWDREVETGALLAACVPRGCRVVLQAPRGSLEAVHPRPLVELAGRRLLETGRYGPALQLLRKHKIDLSKLALFPGLDVAALVRAVPDADRLCLFLTQLGEGPCAAELVNRICAEVRAAVGADETLVNVALTAWVQQRPPQLPQALAVVAALRLRHCAQQTVYSARAPRAGKDPSERALDYLTFLVPAERLFEEALGMYDFDLVTVVAKKGQKDPREYVPFLEGLRRLSGPRMRHAIDVRLQRWESALANLAREEGALEECLQLVRERRLFRFALTSVWPEGEGRRRCYGCFAEYLEGKGHAAEAAICWGRAREPRRERQCAEQLGDWAWALARAGGDEEAAAAVAAVLDGQHRWEELGRLRAWRAAAPGAPALRREAGVAECLARAGLGSEALLWDEAAARASLLRQAAERASLLRGHATRLTQLAGRLHALRAARATFEAEAGSAPAPENPSEYSVASAASSRASGASGASSLATLAQGRAAQQARAAKKGAGDGGGGRRLTGKPGSMHEEEWLHRELRALLPDEPLLRALCALLVCLLRLGCDAEAQALQSAAGAAVVAAEAALPEMLLPCRLHGHGGVTYLQHWVPAPALHVTVAPEHADSPAVDSVMLAPRAAVATTFQWRLVLLDP